ncbi:HAD-IIB family hydrolase [Leekyejoonella antrihumi]|uniref:phosphomannomutase n=1 Tax=Leekyejoonella antrihumi TaxID=1660198 RepID=A0A563E8L9_9MICO|nr:HAD-IIB family hydrolase [Leekyejoonella antrihumi]TWP38659.1 HAD-IIB family hydrolase [Leekyejoonella antrihumi]
MDVPKNLRVLAFDLDDTLAESKCPISPQMGSALSDLLGQVQVLIISGGTYNQFETQVVEHLPRSADLSNLHLMPTCGTRYLRWDPAHGWTEQYSHDLEPGQRRTVAKVLEQEARALGVWEPQENVFGPRIEDRGSQMTFSGLGQSAPTGLKKLWDPGGDKRDRLRVAVQRLLPDLEVRSGGSTSIDITRKGIDKSHGLQMLSQVLGIELSAMHFVGDRLDPGGNDYPVKALGVSTFQVENAQACLQYVRAILDRLTLGAHPRNGSKPLPGTRGEYPPTELCTFAPKAQP